MPTTVLIPVRCERCGRLYHVPPSTLEQRAKCRPCGHEFALPASNFESSVGRRVVTAHQNAPMDRLFSSQMAHFDRARSAFQRRQQTTSRCLGKYSRIAGAVDGTRQREPSGSKSASWREGTISSRSAGPTFGAARRVHRSLRSVVELVEAVEPSVVVIKTGAGTSVVDSCSMIRGWLSLVSTVLETQLAATVTFADGRREQMKYGLRASTRTGSDIAIIQVSHLSPMVALPVAIAPDQKGGTGRGVRRAGRPLVLRERGIDQRNAHECGSRRECFVAPNTKTCFTVTIFWGSRPMFHSCKSPRPHAGK